MLQPAAVPHHCQPTPDISDECAVFCLPAELLREVFCQFASLENPPLKSWPYEHYEHVSRRNLLRSRNRITHVCKLWREVAHSIPSLWNDLRVYLHDEDDIHFTDEWLKRSGDLSLALSLLYYDLGDLPGPLLSGLQLLMPLTHRIRSLTFRFLCSDTVFSFLHRVSPHFPVLESLQLELKMISEDYPDKVLAFTASTKLTSLKLNVNQGKLLNFLAFPPDQLTSFDLIYEGKGMKRYIEMNADALLKMLSSLTRLMECRIECPDRVVDPSSSSITIHLPSLRSLELDVKDHSWLRPSGSRWHLLRALEAPSLQFLHLHHEDYEDYPTYVHFGIHLVLDFQLRSRAPITELILDGVPFSSKDELKTVLSTFPSVTHLSYFQGYFDMGILMDVLRYREGCEPVLPALEYLAFDLLWESLHRIYLLADLLESRWWPLEDLANGSGKVSRLEHIRIGKINTNCFGANYGFDSSVRRRINACRIQGLRLDHYPYEVEEDQ